MSNSWKITFRGKEVTNPAAKFSLTILAALVGALSVIFAVLMVVLLVCLSPVLIPLHFLQKAFGMQGMVRENYGKVEVVVDHTSFYFSK
jgi:hypothetical protein